MAKSAVLYIFSLNEFHGVNYRGRRNIAERANIAKIAWKFEVYNKLLEMRHK
jgi:hypothetical protein